MLEVPDASGLSSSRGVIASGRNDVVVMEVTQHQGTTMPASLHHMIIPVSDRDVAARYFTGLLELREPWENGFFQSVQLDDSVVINFAAPPVEVQPQHYAFLVSDELFDRIKSRFDSDGTPYTADPPGKRPSEVGEVNRDGTGRRLYFLGPDKHMLEVLTARYNDVPQRSRPQ
ncbi:VOC family protein [Micromonospora sp. STR1_7]|uniref:VOC family protein n=1 Tax=Micromonospora parastrephiae TaxID=2806101 RepID=A0ABS1XNN6_9ACTN|nr:VOC family protein [Micromonospora parastrephiae]MBM0230875.1 VOC family protein [Micromonospora parastrephiae]